MNSARRFAGGLMTLAFLAACGRNGVGPTPLSPPPTPPEIVNGEITITSMVPEPGATVPVRACAPGSDRFCADHPQLSFDVVVDRDIPDATLFVSFGGCGFATTPPGPLFADTRVALTTSVIMLSDDGPQHDGLAAEPLCPFPAVTSRMFVRLWLAGEPNRALLTREFASGYTFSMP